MAEITHEFDSVGVVLEKDAYGKYAMYRIFVTDGLISARELITDNRALGPAMREGQSEFDIISLNLTRGRYSFNPVIVRSAEVNRG